MVIKGQGCAHQPVQICENGGRINVAQFQFLCPYQCPWELLFQHLHVIIDAADSANGGQHWKEMAEQNAQIFIFLPFNRSYVEDHVGEEQLDFVKEIQYLGIKISGKN